jgi:anti-sigma regulatory factor (Ser/Thr protein kinase)
MAAIKMDLGVHRDVLAAPASVGVARRFVTATLREWGLDRYAEPATAIISELATNAVEVSAADAVVRVHVSVRSGELWLAVLDGVAQVRPVSRRTVTCVDEVDAAGEGEFGGWGLQLAGHHADRLWFEDAEPESGCKWVCAAIQIVKPG